jgi:hypothetical protein
VRHLPLAERLGPVSRRATRESANQSPRRLATHCRALSYWRSRASSEHEAARIDAVFEQQIVEGPDFARYHRDSDFSAAPKVRLDLL